MFLYLATDARKNRLWLRAYTGVKARKAIRLKLPGFRVRTLTKVVQVPGWTDINYLDTSPFRW